MTTTNAPREILDVARKAVDSAQKKGARQAAARVSKVREVSVQWRDGKIEQVQEATSRGLTLQLYVDGRYSVVSSSDLRPEALDTFVADAVAMTRVLAEDPFRALPEPELYKGQATVDLKLEDPGYGVLTAEKRRAMASELEKAARSVPGAEAILSVTTGFSDTRAETVRVASNGFEGSRITTAFFATTQVSVKDADGRRPEDFDFAGSRFFSDLPGLAEVGRRATERALARRGARKAESATLTMVLDNRAVGRLVGALGGALGGRALQQKQSFLEGKLGTAVGSPLFTVADEPLLVKGLGSRLWDDEGLAARRLPVFEGGVLKAFLIDTYYGRKLKMAPTTGGFSNLDWKLGERTQAQLLEGVKDGILVTSFLGGNSNPTTGDFSFGVAGFRVRAGQKAEPVSEMNISGNLGEVFKKLVAVGNDPYPYSALRAPTMVFEGIPFAGV